MLQDAGYLPPADAKHFAARVDDRLARGVDEIRRQRQALNAAVDVGREIEDGISVTLGESIVWPNFGGLDGPGRPSQ